LNTNEGFLIGVERLKEKIKGYRMKMINLHTMLSEMNTLLSH